MRVPIIRRLSINLASIEITRIVLIARAELPRRFLKIRGHRESGKPRSPNKNLCPTAANLVRTRRMKSVKTRTRPNRSQVCGANCRSLERETGNMICLLCYRLQARLYTQARAKPDEHMSARFCTGRVQSGKEGICLHTCKEEEETTTTSAVSISEITTFVDKQNANGNKIILFQPSLSLSFAATGCRGQLESRLELQYECVSV